MEYVEVTNQKQLDEALKRPGVIPVVKGDGHFVIRSGSPEKQAIPFTNSWGDSYPLTTWMPVATFARLLGESGEAAVYSER